MAGSQTLPMAMRGRFLLSPFLANITSSRFVTFPALHPLALSNVISNRNTECCGFSSRRRREDSSLNGASWSAASRPQASGGVRARSSAAAMTAGASASKIQLYSLATPNGMKAGIALEEMGLEYDAHRIDITKGEQLTPEFLAINPNGKIPAIVDLDGPGGKPYNVFESGAILMYLAEKTGKFLPEDPALRWETIQWLFFQVGGVGPMFGQFGHFYKYAKDKCQDPYPVTRYTTEAKRLLGVLEARLEGRDYLTDAGYTIADMATFPWVHCLEAGYGAAEHLELEGSFPRVMAWKRRCAERPLTAKGMTVCKM